MEKGAIVGDENDRKVAGRISTLCRRRSLPNGRDPNVATCIALSHCDVLARFLAGIIRSSLVIITLTVPFIVHVCPSMVIANVPYRPMRETLKEQEIVVKCVLYIILALTRTRDQVMPSSIAD